MSRPPDGADAAVPVDAAIATTGGSVLRGGLWYTASSGIPQVYTAIISVVAARVLGADGFGQQSYIALNSILLSTLLTSSMYVAMMRYVGESVGAGRPEALRSLLAWAWRIEGAAAVLAAAILGGAALVGARPHAAWAIAGVGSALIILHTVPTSVLIGLQRFRQAAIVGLTTGFVSTIATTIVLLAGGGITGMFATEAVFAALNLVWTGTLARRSLGPPVPAPADARDLQRRVGRYALISAVGVLVDLVVATRSEFFFLKVFSSERQMALYTISFSIIVALRLVPSALASTVAPAFATLFGAGEIDRICSGYTRAFRLVVIVTLPLTAAALALGPELVRLVYGVEYEAVGPPLRIMVTVLPLIALSSLAGAYLAGIGRVRLPLAANTLAAVVDVALAFALVPALDARGAAVANAAGQSTYAVVSLVAGARILGASDWRFSSLLRSVAAAAAAGAAGWVVLDQLEGLDGLLAGASTLTVVYLAAAVALGVLTPDDADWLESAIGGRVGGRLGRLARLVASN